MSQIEKPRILIVDDEILLAKALAFELEDFFPCQTVCASSGTEALNLISEFDFRLVISDVHMPNGDGIFLLKEIKKMNPSIPVVILMTGESKYNQNQVKELGACALLQKPLDLDKLQKIVTEHLKT